MTPDWQFVVVTVIALGAALLIVRRFLPARRRTAGGRGPALPVACDHCDTGAKATAGAAPSNESTRRTQTTPVVSVDELRASAKRRRG